MDQSAAFLEILFGTPFTLRRLQINSPGLTMTQGVSKMKPLISRIAIAFLITSLMGITAVAKTRRGLLKLDTTFKVNGTVLQKGNYDLKLEEDKNELLILRNGKVVVRANVATEQREKKAGQFEIHSKGDGDDRQLTGIAFGGSRYNVVIRDSQASK
jgi:hypothetical protein